MNWGWPLAVAIVAVLLFAYCTYTTDQATRSIDRALDSFDDQACYEAGYNAALAGQAEAPVSRENEECGRWLEAGFSDGRRAYKAYEGVLGD